MKHAAHGRLPDRTPFYHREWSRSSVFEPDTGTRRHGEGEERTLDLTFCRQACYYDRMIKGILSRWRPVTLLIVVLAIVLGAIPVAFAAQANRQTAPSGPPAPSERG